MRVSDFHCFDNEGDCHGENCGCSCNGCRMARHKEARHDDSDNENSDVQQMPDFVAGKKVIIKRPAWERGYARCLKETDSVPDYDQIGVVVGNEEKPGHGDTILVDFDSVKVCVNPDFLEQVDF